MRGGEGRNEGGEGRNEGEELIGMVKEATGTNMLEKKLWYSLKYDREMLPAVEWDTDVKMTFKGNDERDYLHVGGNKGSLGREHEGVVVLGSAGRLTAKEVSNT